MSILGTIVITGGSGFIGSRSAKRFVKCGYQVVILDNFSRPSSRSYLETIITLPGITVHELDIRDQDELMSCMRHYADAVAIIHLAAQVGVTASILDPFNDFSINAQGTLNVLEVTRALGMKSLVVFSSTNKVYGSSCISGLVEGTTRYMPSGPKLCVDEQHPLNCETPYGCSKGTAEMYLKEYNRTYDIPSVILRQSCICGPGQLGVAEQGWVSWMMRAHTMKIPITVFGDGKQVRDILHVEDLIDLLEHILLDIPTVRGRVYNVGGGLENAVSVLELIDFLRVRNHGCVECSFDSLRPFDQLYYVSDIDLVHGQFGWRPKRTRDAILEEMFLWVKGQVPGLG